MQTPCLHATVGTQGPLRSLRRMRPALYQYLGFSSHFRVARSSARLCNVSYLYLQRRAFAVDNKRSQEAVSTFFKTSQAIQRYREYSVRRVA